MSLPSSGSNYKASKKPASNKTSEIRAFGAIIKSELYVLYLTVFTCKPNINAVIMRRYNE
jgi:hypothetical protein